MAADLDHIHNRIRQYLWRSANPGEWTRFLRALYLVITSSIHEDYVDQSAKALVYTTLLSLVPFLAISFSLLKAFGAHNQIKPFLYDLLAPLGDKGNEIAANILGFIDNVNVGMLGAIGVVVFLYTVVSVVSRIERTLNYLWCVRKPRPFVQRFTYYLSVILISPLLLIAALGLSASLMSGDVVQGILSVEPFGSIYFFLAWVTPYLTLTLAFALIYTFLPNTKVELYPALVGAFFAAILWKLAGFIFAEFVATSSNYDAIYSGFAALIVFLLWLYASWLIFLSGGQLTFYFQNPGQGDLASLSKMPNIRQQENLMLQVFYCVAENFQNDQGPWTIKTLAKELKLPYEVLIEILEVYRENQLIAYSEDVEGKILLQKDLGNISLRFLLQIIRECRIPFKTEPHKKIEAVIKLQSKLEQATDLKLGETSVRDWLQQVQ